MGTPKPRFTSKPSVAERIEELRSIEDIDAMLLEGSSCRDVAKFIQQALEELTEVDINTIEQRLKERRRRLREEAEADAAVLRPVEDDEEEPERPAAIVPDDGGRRMGRMASAQYDRVRKGIERMLELECAYLAARDRLDFILDKEQSVGFPFEMTGREFLVLGKLLELHGKEDDRVRAIMGQGHAHEALDLKGYSEQTAKVLANPASRRRVVSIVERLKLIKGGRDIPDTPELAEASGE
jgi:hypothetical protein